jgi:transcriptional regulator with XRE-family HTH domain
MKENPKPTRPIHIQILEKLLLDSNVSQNYAAKQMKISQASISRWFSGKRGIGGKHIMELVEVVGMHSKLDQTQIFILKDIILQGANASVFGYDYVIQYLKHNPWLLEKNIIEYIKNMELT